jgi:hypothetical protein
LEPLPKILRFRWLDFNQTAVTFLRQSGCWADFKFLENLVSQHASDNTDILLLGELSCLLGLVLSRYYQRAALSGNENKNGKAPFHTVPGPNQMFSKCLVFLTDVHPCNVTQVIAKAHEHAADGAEILLILHPESHLGGSPEHIRDCIIAQIDTCQGSGDFSLRISSIGGPLFWTSRKLAGKVARYFKSNRSLFSIRRVRHLFKLVPFALLNLYLIWRTKGVACGDHENHTNAMTIALSFKIRKRSQESEPLSV